jgi:hypothetical protein
MPRPGPPDNSNVGKGKGFTMKMGDRAFVKQKFTLEERQAKEGKGTVDGAAQGDEYGVEILLGAGGMVRCCCQHCASVTWQCA